MAGTRGGGASGLEPPDRSCVQIYLKRKAEPAIKEAEPIELYTRRSDRSGAHQAYGCNAGGKSKKLIDLNKQPEEDGNLDLNVAADTLGVHDITLPSREVDLIQKVEKSRYEWEGLDHLTSKETYESLKEDIQNSRIIEEAKPDEQFRFMYVTKEEDNMSLPGLQNSELIAVKAPPPPGTTLEEVKVNDRLFSGEAHNLVDDIAKFVSPDQYPYDVDLEWARSGGGRFTYTEMLCNEPEQDENKNYYLDQDDTTVQQQQQQQSKSRHIAEVPYKHR